MTHRGRITRVDLARKAANQSKHWLARTRPVIIAAIGLGILRYYDNRPLQIADITGSELVLYPG